ncbi:SDR family oxidoreductase [Neorhizobium sp. Rsf11]|uniref:SDR family oxidoreductase n=2 Tax=Neorhizobium TaxID=1525371 RepID=A0ABV0LYV9_9HYPH|nr:SDR family oxidoreductase [Neorhizobium petrolearium]MCC2612303.1 SDR family oxidoreductase [Neorhizobium petrolearium]WGI67442.1 SDR family oxidoreductase [Neorhizobium petrolearium]
MTSPCFSLKGRRALVTGASSGIGRAVALGLAEQGAGVILHHFGNETGAREVARAIGDDTPVLEADFTDQRAIAAFADNVVNRYGPIDILIANAAIERRLPWQEVDEAHINAHVAANFSALLALTGKLVPPMAERGWGRVIATGSIMAARPRAETVVYASLKAAQLTAVRAIARDVGHRGVTLNVVSPGAIQIEANAERYSDPEFLKAVTAKIPVGRQGQPEDLVGAFVFLCSDAASYITGANIPVDGGWSIGDAPGTLPGASG